IAQETGMSKTRMSQLVREMIDMNIAEGVFKKEVRKDLYTVEEDYYDTFIYLFTSTWQQSITRSRHYEKKQTDRLDELKKQDLTDENAAARDELQEELDEWKEYFDWIRRVIEFFESGEIFEHVPKK